MPPKEIDPIEKKSYGKIFFVLGSLFFLSSLWAFYDEFIGRRTWKEYQRSFKALELQKLAEEYRQTKTSFEEEDRRRDGLPEGEAKESELSSRRIRLKIEEAEIRMESEEGLRAQAELAKKKIRLVDIRQRYGFTKADQDEVFYEWKHLLLKGEEERGQKLKEEYYRLEEETKELKGKVQEAEGEMARLQEGVDRYQNEIKKWKDWKKKSLEPLTKIEAKVAEVRARGLDIRQQVLPDLGKGGAVQWGRVDRCESCHSAINQAGFEGEKNPFKTHPHQEEVFQNHPIEQFGCTTCHGGQGRATQIKGEPFGEGDFVHGMDHHSTEPLLRGDFLQSSCNKCHQDQWKLEFAPVSQKGKKLFWNLGCTGCHNLKGFEAAPKVGPSLLKIADKVSEEWLIRWIQEPRAYLPKAKMPKAPLDIEEPGQIEKVAAYLLQSSEHYPFPMGRYPGGDPTNGRRLFETVGCYGCHAVGGKGSGLAAPLDRIAEKTSADWIFNWVQDPKSFNPEAKMPRLRLSPREAADITAFLTGQGRPHDQDQPLRERLRDPQNAQAGYLLISQYGCYGCHSIKGHEGTSKLSVELTAFGKKGVEELDFGDTKIPRKWEDWTKGKLKDPRMFLTERTSSRMPNFGLTDEEVEALLIFLKGLKQEEVPGRYIMSELRPRQKEIEEGRRLTDRLNCKGCHLVEGEGRLIQAYLEDPGMAPPILDGIGARVRPEWMFAFLKDPNIHPVRPWLNVRMPTFEFSDGAANTVIRYFSALDKVRSDFYSPVGAPMINPETWQAAHKLISPDYFSCYSCHVRGGLTPGTTSAQWGPDLRLVRERIRPEFIPPWIQDPQKFTPGVIMPAFLPDDDAAPKEILGGDRKRQSEAIRDYLLNLR